MRNKLLPLALTGLMAAACSETDGFDSTCTYYVSTDSIVYSQPTTHEVDSVVRLAIREEGISSYTFETSSKGQSSYDVALYKCDEQAVNAFLSSASKRVSLDDFESGMRGRHTDFFATQGESTDGETTLSPFRIYVKLINMSGDEVLSTSTINVR